MPLVQPDTLEFNNVRKLMARQPLALREPLLAFMERKAREDADLAALRAIRQYRKFLVSADPAKTL